MSVAVKTVFLPSPILDFAESNAPPFVDHSPIYQSLTLSVTIGGAYTQGNIDFSYNGSASKTWTRIPLLPLYGTSPVIELPDEFGTQPQNGVLKVSQFATNFGQQQDNEMLMSLGYAAFKDEASIVNLYGPIYQTAGFFLGGSFVIAEDEVIGTRTDNGEDPPVTTDILADIRITPPTFAFTETGGIGRSYPDALIASSLVSGLGGVDVVEDVKTWTPTKWRDFRGTYSEETTDSNGVTISFTMTIS